MIVIAAAKTKAAMTTLIPATDRCMIMITMIAVAAEIVVATLIMIAIVMMHATINNPYTV